MPRIDPLALLNCLSVLLGPSGGIKGTKEVDRLVTLMTKFSKKLVSKCIYIQILKTTSTDLLNQFMSTGGWDLIHIWLTDAILAKNWALIQELLELLLLCPVDIARLKSNNNPKLIKGLSKEGSHQGVRILACRLVEQWLKIVKDSVPPVPAVDQTNQQIMPPNHIVLSTNKQQIGLTTESSQDIKVKIELDKQRETSTVKVQDLALNNSSCVSTFELNTQQQLHDKIHIQPVQFQIVNKTLPGQTQPTQIKKQSFVVVSNTTTQHHHHQPSVPVYKITIRDGKQVLTKVETDASNITNIFSSEDNGKTLDTDMDNVSVENNSIVIKSECENNSVVECCRTLEETTDSNSEVNHMSISFKDDNVESKTIKDIKDDASSDSNNKSNDKENHDSHKKDDKIIVSTDKKNHHHSSSSSSKSSNSKHTSSSSRSRSSSHKSSSHRSNSSNSSKSSSSSFSKSSKDKDHRHHSSKRSGGGGGSSSSSSSSNKGKSDKEKEREKEKEKQKKDQAEKDKATLEKIQGQTLSTKFGKIPKRKAEDEKSTDSLLQRKSSADSRDSSKENKDKTDPRKSPSTTQSVLEKKNISISIENRKNSLDTSRPKTVKTFNSKFRSTGLEEEIKPPPPRSAGKKPASSTNDHKKIAPSKLTLKRPSPIKESGVSDKRAKLSLDPPVTPPPPPPPPPGDDKKGAIKLIPPKPKPMVLQESDMFMDALTASTKSKEPRKRKRRSSLSKDGLSSDSKKSEANSLLGETCLRDTTSPPVSSPPESEERSSFSIKPEFKFYQDTLETDEDKEEKKKVSPPPQDDDESQMDRKEKDKCENFDDDEGSRTPTCDEEVDEIKPPASPDDAEDNTKDPASPNAEIRYVDGLRSVLLLQKRKGPKKNLKWKTELESIRYFELDETERVNVTKTFTDMKQMEKQNEREAFQMARKLSTEDLMEERTRWKALISIDLPPALVEPGKDSKEKDIQYAREKGILQALYFNRSMIPDSAAEPDEERHHIITDPKIIPLEDLTGNKESEKDFTMIPWPEPKPQIIQTSQSVNSSSIYQAAITHNLGALSNLGPGIQPIMGGSGITQQMAPNIMPVNHTMPGGGGGGGGGDIGGGGWRTGDGKVVVPDIDINNMNSIPNLTGFPPSNMIHPPGMFNHHQQQQQQQQQQDGFIMPMMGMEEGSFAGHMPNNFPTPGLFGPGPNLQGPPPPPPPPRGGMHGNRMRGGPGWFRGGMGPVRGGWAMRGNWRGSGGGGGGKQPPVCRQFTKNGFCRIGDKCQYLHPGVNCPPF